MIVVGCGKSKLPHAAPARDLYTGSLFRMARRYAEARGGPWVVLSGAHGVVSPEWVIRPYDAGPPRDRAGLARWARMAALDIEQRRSNLMAARLLGTPVEILAGAAYASKLAEELEALGIESAQPLERLGLGRRLGRLREMIEDVTAGRVAARA